MQMEEAGRAERVRAEAVKLRAKARLPPRMQQEEDSRVRETRKSADMERIRAGIYTYIHIFMFPYISIHI